MNKMCKTRIQEEIKALMSLYHLGKAPLSYALGFGEITITRYLQGSTPHPDYAQVIHSALCDIDYMMDLVNKNHEKMGPAFKKAINRCLTLKSQFSCSKEILQVISYLFYTLEELTPMQLESYLYFIQAYSYPQPLFHEHCEAWKQGVIYPDVYHLFSTFPFRVQDDMRYKIIEDAYFDLDENKKEYIDEILNTFSRYPLKTLITLTKTGPWKTNYKKGDITIIPAEDIQNYFKRH